MAPFNPTYGYRWEIRCVFPDHLRAPGIKKNMYIRYQGTRNSGKTGKPSGIFAVAWHMKSRGHLTSDEIEEIQQIENWFEDNLPNPAFYEKANPRKAITWFKQETTTEMIEKIERIKTIIERNGWQIEVEFRETSPGKVIYEDEYQIATI